MIKQIEAALALSLVSFWGRNDCGNCEHLIFDLKLKMLS